MLSSKMYGIEQALKGCFYHVEYYTKKCAVRRYPGDCGHHCHCLHFWGVGTQLKNPSNALAVVNGQEIGYRDFQQTYERAVEQYKQQFGGQLPDKFLESVRLKEQVLEQLVQRELLRQGAEEMGLFISNEATQRKSRRLRLFPKRRFDLEQYDKVLEQNRLSPAIFESGILMTF
jgi:peptidyl-prolyl cis-trans isomerase D